MNSPQLGSDHSPGASVGISASLIKRLRHVLLWCEHVGHRIHAWFVLGEGVRFLCKGALALFFAVIALLGLSSPAQPMGSKAATSSSAISLPKSLQPVSVGTDVRLLAINHEGTALEAERRRDWPTAERERLAAAQAWRKVYSEQASDESCRKIGEQILLVDQRRMDLGDLLGALSAVDDARAAFNQINDQSVREGWLVEATKHEGIILGRLNKQAQARDAASRAVAQADLLLARKERDGSAGSLEYGTAFVTRSELLAIAPELLTTGVAQDMRRLADRMLPVQVSDTIVSDMTAYDAQGFARELQRRAPQVR